MCRYNHVYPGVLNVELQFFSVEDFQGEIRNMVFEQIAWVKFSDLSGFDFLEGDVALVSKLVSSNGLIYQR